MILRGYQQIAVEKAKAALKQSGNTLVVAATGAGKTIMLSALAREMKGKTLVLQHRQELIQQNAAKFNKVNPDWNISFYTADEKSFKGDAVFAMQQTMCRHLAHLPKFDHIICDEVHHIVAPTFVDIIDACKNRNPDVMLSGFTATPVRGDKKSLKKYFNNTAESITIRQLVEMGFLVPPKAYVLDVGVCKDLMRIKNASEFGDQNEVAALLDTQLINDEVIRHWREKANGRKTIIFCATIKHAFDVAEAFNNAGISSAVVHGNMRDNDRNYVLHCFDKGNLQIVCNVAVLTEGYDSQQTSCVILLRKCSQKGSLIQMIGRGLRTVDTEIYQGVIKKDCVILDFGISLRTHEDLEQGDGLHNEELCDVMGLDEYNIPQTKECPNCNVMVSKQVRKCTNCGFVFGTTPDKGTLTYVELAEIDILNSSPFRWIDLFGTDLCLMANGFSGCWAGVFSPDKGETWVAMGKLKDEKHIHTLTISGRKQAISAADDFFRINEKSKNAKKTAKWFDDPATEKQWQTLANYGYDCHYRQPNHTKYWAACHLNFNFNRRQIEKNLKV